MSAPREPLKRIAAALERLAPAVAQPTDWLAHPAYLWTGTDARPVAKLETVGLDQLCGIDEQKSALTTNLERLAAGASAHDMLLWGARGMGKSALVRAAVKSVESTQPGRLALVQIETTGLDRIGSLIEALSKVERGIVLFIDDLGFGADQGPSNRALRSLLDGGLVSRPTHVRLAVTSNRRAIVARDSDEHSALHERDERDNALALADRFGMTLGFHPCDRETYLAILDSYVEPLGLSFDEEEALAWAIARGNRSGRTAFQFACELAGRAGLLL